VPGAPCAGLNHCSKLSAAFPIVVNVGVPVRAFVSHGTRAAGLATASWQPGMGVQHQMSRVSALG
jgi:hypothetical protein